METGADTKGNTRLFTGDEVDPPAVGSDTLRRDLLIPSRAAVG